MGQDVAAVAAAERASASAYAQALRRNRATPLLSAPVSAPLLPDELAMFQTATTFEQHHDHPRFRGWADRSGCQATGTRQRLLLSHRLQGWLSVWFADVTRVAVEPGDRDWRVELDRLDQAPIRLAGPAVALVAVHAAAMVHPESWWHWPSFAGLLGPTDRA